MLYGALTFPEQMEATHLRYHGCCATACKQFCGFNIDPARMACHRGKTRVRSKGFKYDNVGPRTFDQLFMNLQAPQARRNTGFDELNAHPSTSYPVAHLTAARSTCFSPA
jgi:hypothetical protein